MTLRPTVAGFGDVAAVSISRKGAGQMIFVHTLGTASIDVGSFSITPTSPRKFALLLYMAAQRGRRVPRSVLQELIFPDQAERNARHSLRELLYQLRQMGSELKAGSDGIELRCGDARIDCDEVVTSDAVSPEQVQGALGGFLPGFAPTHSEAYSDWYEAYRAQSISGLCRALLKALSNSRHSGDCGFAERVARACLSLDPLNEEATLGLAEVLLLTGAKAAAVQLLEQYMEEVGRISPDLRIPAKILRRRIDASKPLSSRAAPRFVGRSQELAFLRRLLRRTVAGEAQSVAICGEPGIGKSRLLSEFWLLAELEGARGRTVSMQPHDNSRPLGAFVDLVPGLLTLPGALGCSPESMEALSRVTSRSNEDHNENGHPYALEAVASSITEAIGDLCEAISAEAPLLLAIEDAQWTDGLSRKVLSRLVSSRQSSRILILLTTRDSRAFSCSARDLARVHVLPLTPLPTDTIHQLIDDVLQLLGCDLSSQARSRLTEIAAGNPLFAISLANHYHDTHDSVSIPPTLVDFLGRRLEPLSNTSINVLTTCVALGKHCTTDRLLRVLELPTAFVLDALLDLTDSSLLSSGDEKIAAAHPLLAEVVVKKAAPSVWRVVNHGAAQVFEDDALELGSPAHWWEAAIRWREAGEHERALAAFRRCAHHAMAMGRPSDAARMLSDALLVPISRDLTILAAKELVIAGDRAFQPSWVFRAKEVLASENYLIEHDEVELAIRQAVFRETTSTDQIFEETSGCLRSRTASPEHRVLAATLALKTADLLGADPRVATIIEEEISADDLLQVSRQLQLEFKLLMKSARHDRLGAASVASELLNETNTLPLAAQVTTLHNAGTALFLAGNLDTALSSWERSFEVACALKLPTQQVRIAAHIAGMYSDLRDDAQTALWMSRALGAASDAPEPAQTLYLLSQQICRAFESGDIDHAEELLDSAQDLDLFSHGVTRCRWGRAFELLLQVRRCRVSDADRELAKAIFADRASSISGYRDLEIAAAAETLMTKDSTEAAKLLRIYLDDEREHHRLMDRQLGDVLRRLGLKLGKNVDFAALRSPKHPLPDGGLALSSRP